MKPRTPSASSQIVKIAAALALGPVFFFSQNLYGHGMGHSHSTHSHDEESSCDHPHHRHMSAGADADGTDMFAEAADETTRERWWGASLNTFWESKHIHYGITEADGSSVYGTELGIGIENLSLNASGIFALENDFQEWNFTAAYTVEVGPVFITPGYNFRWTPGHGHGSHGHSDHEEHGHDDHEEHDHEEHHEEHGDEHGHDDHGHDDHGHDHGEFGNELFLVVGTTAIPYVTPSVGFLWDLSNNGNGGFMEIRLDGDIPVYKRIVRLAPYTVLGLNFGYNTDEYYGWNNFLYGVNLNVSLTRNITVYGGVGQNVAFQAARDAGTSNEVFANTGVSFSF